MSNKKPYRSSSNARQRNLEVKGTAQALKKAKERTVQQPANLAAWKQLGAELSEVGQFDEALIALERASALVSDDAETLALKGRITHQAGNPEQALIFLHDAIKLNPNYAKAQHYIGYIYYTQARFNEALQHAEIACELVPDDVDMLNTLGNTLMQAFEYNRAKDALEKAARLAPKNYLSWNNLGNVYNAIGDLDKGLESYWQAHRVNPQAPGPFSNIITTYHYHPEKTGKEITALCKKWESKFLSSVTALPLSNLNDPQKRLRVGLISDGFRGHPVGRMITSALEHVSKSQIAFYFYSTNNASDGITERLKSVAEQWMSVQPLKDQQVAEQIVNDGIDILIDLAGHNAGNRVLAVSMQPAPVQVKWVGGLINTTGLSAIDYLISDSIETPENVDEDYVEKLIRLPDDYICYVPPNGYEPNVGVLPAIRNGYITLGCFNNASKLNSVVLEQWAKIMLALPNSKLMLKSMQYKSEERCQKIKDTMALYGIESDRLLIEGPSPHAELLDAYNKVDISLDPWPYSGGLTTCESFLMGVPVVSLPGPTFAGRHSATHLINAGMPELVVSSWEEYRERVLELASDLDSLSTIRQHLRQVLLESPVCDASRFAKHFTDAMRSIWQRHCEGKQPAALTFDKMGLAKFEDEETPVNVVYAESMESGAVGFNWSLPSKIIALDNGSKLVVEKGIDTLRQLNAFGIVAFDPASQVINAERFEGSKDVQIFTHAVLGDGSPATLYSCLDPALSSILEPLPKEQQYGANLAGTNVLAKLPINTIALDSTEGLDSLDWLILDDLSDSTAILENGEKALKDTLVIQVRIAFQPTHKRQPNLAETQHWMSRHGFRFYRFNNQQHLSHLPDSVSAEIRQATELQSADAIFLPTHERLAELSENQRSKLAFLLHTVYGIKDMAYEVLVKVDEKKAEKYLFEERLLNPSIDESNTDSLKESSPRLAYSPANSEQLVSDSASTYNDTLNGDAELPQSDVQESAHNDVARNSNLTKSQLHKKPTALWELDGPIYVIDIGANPIDGTPPYAGLLQRGLVNLIGFEPQKDALQKLLTMKGPNETYLPHAVGTGEKTKLYICQASGMTSTLKPNNQVLDHFQGYPIWGKVKSIEEIDTVRLDDVSEITKIDWLKIDIQGGELNVFKNAETKLKNALVIQTEVNFIQLYENQPLFAEIDQWMRANGFMLHTLLEQRRRLYAPMKINGGIHQGINQLTTADAVYIKDINRASELTEDEVKKMAFILHEAYGSYDLSLRLIKNFLGEGVENKYIKKIKKQLPLIILQNEDFSLKHCFVVGCGHTGTTLIATILGENDAIYSIKRETGWFLDNQNIDSDLFREELHAKELRSDWLCEKTPRHVYCYEKIMARFTDAKFIVMTREAKDVVASIKNRTGDFSQALNRWLNDSKKSLEVSRQKNSLLIHYEDVVADAENTIQRMCDFLGVPFSQAMLSYHESKNNWFGVNPQKTDGKGEQAHLERRAWQMQQPIQDRRGTWKDILTKEEAETVDTASRKIMLELGYDV